VWVWPSRYDAHDPVEWQIGMGRFDRERWRREYQELFEGSELVRNHRDTVKTEVSEQGDGAFAVVDIDTLWRHRETGQEMRWKGRVCKVYSLVADEWKLTQHTGALETATDARAAARAWVDGWLRSWPSKDPEPVASRYSENGVFLSHPFRDPLVGPAGAREYVTWATEDQAAVECAFAEPIVSGDRAAVEWWAVITLRDGSQETVVGTSVIRFAPDGRVLEDCDYWACEPGRREPPPTFKPTANAQG
jgi:ketosteroid isomerase-like protein